MSRMRELPLFPATSDDPVQTLLEIEPRAAAKLRAGSVRLAPNQRVPFEGLSVHGADELSLIVSGSLSGESGGEPFAVGAGDVTLIPAGEEHWAVAGDGGTEIFWVWFGTLDGEG